MIRLTCTSCKNVLTIDDAFAGGVCRCQHCGTIQTVPANLKGSAERAGTATVGTGKNAAKTLYRSDKSMTGSGSGLDELAEVVHSSGLQRSDLRRPPATAVNNNRRNLLIFGVAIGAVLAAVVVYVVLNVPNHNGAEPNPTPNQSINTPNVTPPSPTPQAPAGPSFGPIEITGHTVVYLIDDGSSAHDSLDGIKQECLRSIRSLGPDRRFLIQFWKKTDTASYPASGTPIAATSANADDAQTHLADVTAFGPTEIDIALKKAIAAQADEIVLITAKGFSLDADWQKTVLAIRGKSSVKIDCVAIGDSADQGVLPKLATATGGKFARIGTNDLH